MEIILDDDIETPVSSAKGERNQESPNRRKWLRKKKKKKEKLISPHAQQKGQLEEKLQICWKGKVQPQ